MRMLIKVQVPTEAGNRTLADGSLPKVIQGVMADLKPEAAFFGVENGLRTGYFFLEMKDSSDMPSVGERFFTALHATVNFIPVMNAEELRSGLARLA